MTRGQLIDITTADCVAEAYLTTPATQDGPVPGVRSSWTRSGCAPASRRWPTASPTGATSSSRRTAARDLSPHLVVPRVCAELVAGHADYDASMPPEAVEALDAALAAAGVTATTAIYAGGPTRLHDGGHVDVRRGVRRASLHRAAGPVRPTLG